MIVRISTGTERILHYIRLEDESVVLNIKYLYLAAYLADFVQCELNKGLCVYFFKKQGKNG